MPDFLTQLNSNRVLIADGATGTMLQKAGLPIGVAPERWNLENPEATDPGSALPELKFSGNSPHDLAKHLYDISAAKHNNEDIRVCAVGGIYSNDSWDIAIINTTDS